jgi:hydroxymethylpyrimidine pyrophosphatase-like HAD family hydrolase
MSLVSAPSIAPRLIVTDLDGTLLGLDGEVSERNAAALGRAVAAGARVVIATGRPVRWLEHLKSSFHSSIAICCNGGMVIDLESGDILTSYELDGGRLHAAVVGLRSTGSIFSIGVEGLPGFGLVVEPDFPLNGRAEVATLPLEGLCAGPVVKVLIRPAEGGADGIRLYLEEFHAADFTVTRSTNDGLIELSRAGITKGAVISGLAEGWGIEASEAIAFGDMPNDIEMLLWAGRSVAMGNADSAVKAIATETALHHDANGVAQVLERWF